MTAPPCSSAPPVAVSCHDCLATPTCPVLAAPAAHRPPIPVHFHPSLSCHAEPCPIRSLPSQPTRPRPPPPPPPPPTRPQACRARTLLSRPVRSSPVLACRCRAPFPPCHPSSPFPSCPETVKIYLTDAAPCCYILQRVVKAQTKGRGTEHGSEEEEGKRARSRGAVESRSVSGVERRSRAHAGPNSRRRASCSSMERKSRYRDALSNDRPRHAATAQRPDERIRVVALPQRQGRARAPVPNDQGLPRQRRVGHGQERQAQRDQTEGPHHGPYGADSRRARNGRAHRRSRTVE